MMDIMVSHVRIKNFRSSENVDVKLGINNINGIQESSKDFWRVKDKSAPHNLFTSTASILKIAQRKGYKTTSENSTFLFFFFLAVPVACESSWIRDQTCATAVTQATSVTTPSS